MGAQPRRRIAEAAEHRVADRQRRNPGGIRPVPGFGVRYHHTEETGGRHEAAFSRMQTCCGQRIRIRFQYSSHDGQRNRFHHPVHDHTKAVKSLITDFSKDVMRPEYDRMHNGHVYGVQERMLGILETDGGFSYVTDSDPEFGDAKHRVKAYVYFDSKKRSDDEQELKSSLMKIIKELDGKKVRNPSEAFSKKAKWMMKYLDMALDEEGGMRISYKQNAMPSSGTGRGCSSCSLLMRIGILLWYHTTQGTAWRWPSTYLNPNWTGEGYAPVIRCGREAGSW